MHVAAVVLNFLEFICESVQHTCTCVCLTMVPIFSFDPNDKRKQPKANAVQLVTRFNTCMSGGQGLRSSKIEILITVNIRTPCPAGVAPFGHQ